MFELKKRSEKLTNTSDYLNHTEAMNFRIRTEMTNDQ